MQEIDSFPTSRYNIQHKTEDSRVNASVDEDVLAVHTLKTLYLFI